MTQTYEIATLHPVFVRQLDALARGDIDLLLENYHQDAVLLRFDGVASGLDELRATLSVYLSLGPELVELSQYVQTDDTVSYRAVMKIGGRAEKAFGTLVLRDGKIWRQTVGFGD